jgi:hypothetical protein
MQEKVLLFDKVGGVGNGFTFLQICLVGVGF